MKRNKLSLFSIPYVVWMAIFVVIPILMVVVYAFSSAGGGFTLDNFARIWDYAVVFTRSFKLALIATVICLLVGYPISCFLAREGAGFQRVAMMLIMLPMWMNFLLRTYAWMSILENTGLLNRFFDAIGLFDLINGLFGTEIEYFKMINTQGAVVLGMVYNFLPFMVFPIYTLLSKMDYRLTEAAADLGCNNWQTLWKVTMPLSIPGIVSGITMVFMPSVTTFFIPRVLGGGNTMMFGDLIEAKFLTEGNWNVGSALSLIMMVLILISLSILRKADPNGEGGGIA